MNLLLKLSGEFISNKELLSGYAEVIQELSKEHNVGVVVGGGNLIRGRNFSHNQREADIIGIYATLVNGLLLKSVIGDAEVCNSFETALINQYNFKNKDKIKIFTGGTGLPYFSTDTTAIIRALDINADLILKATKVDGVYDKDPELESATFYNEISYSNIISQKLKVMDLTAASLALTHNLEMIVFNGTNPQNVFRAIKREIGTTIKEK